MEEKETHDVIKDFLEPKKDPYRLEKEESSKEFDQSPQRSNSLKKDKYGNIIERKVIGNNQLYEEAVKIRHNNRLKALQEARKKNGNKQHSPLTKGSTIYIMAKKQQSSMHLVVPSGGTPS